MRRLHRRSARAAERRFVVEGPQAVREALVAGALEVLYAEPDRQPDLERAARAAGTTVVAVSPPVLAAMAETVTPQGVVGVAALVDVPLDAALAGAPRLVAVLEAVADPGNAGTVLRAADAAGADAVVLTAGSVDPHNGKCVRATAGSLFHLPVAAGVALEECVVAARANGLQLLATSGTGDEDLDDLLDSGVLARPTAWLLGNEATGLSEAALAAADRTVRVPVHGRAESLNLATAAAVCLYASARAQRRSGRT
ncbi:MAG TPA: RNA methyltransferase [Mycobacteriales bacterium]|nr:RNA methyltransferase [Mycobacteriales bacterium]